MAELISGKWSEKPNVSVSSEGEFIRVESHFRNTISPHEASPDRYHLYVSYACPWAHRTLIVLNLKKLENVISFSVTNAIMGARGWTLGSGHELEYLANVYRGADQHYTGKITVPVLWDNRKETIVNNESSDIIRILNSSFNSFTDSEIDLYPEFLRKEIDEMNSKVYDKINNGVYKAGFASSQIAYDHAFKDLFDALNEIENLLGNQPFLVGKKITEADIRLFTTLIRFDIVYYVHFKCNWRLIRDYPHLSNYLRSLYQIPEFQKTCFFDQIKEHYYKSHDWLNPNGIIPQGPEMELNTPHNRGKSEFHLTPIKKTIH